MGHENFESAPEEAPIEKEPVEETNGNDVEPIITEDELGAEDVVTPETSDETPEMDPESLELLGDVPEADLEEEE
ncbi:MAG: hypothetical protein NUV61_01905 [Candidatus Azambacteria bacterium]|nr:hypothetical protein [Candidatus Azambacteria bacterium]